jgi:hypothetical protein
MYVADKNLNNPRSKLEIDKCSRDFEEDTFYQLQVFSDVFIS